MVFDDTKQEEKKKGLKFMKEENLGGNWERVWLLTHYVGLRVKRGRGSRRRKADIDKCIGSTETKVETKGRKSQCGFMSFLTSNTFFQPNKIL